LCFLERSAATTASSASSGGLKQAEAVGSPLPIARTGRGPEASTAEKTRSSTARMLMLPAVASGAPADCRQMLHGRPSIFSRGALSLFSQRKFSFRTWPAAYVPKFFFKKSFKKSLFFLKKAKDFNLSLQKDRKLQRKAW